MYSLSSNECFTGKTIANCCLEGNDSAYTATFLTVYNHLTYLRKTAATQEFISTARAPAERGFLGNVVLSSVILKAMW